MVISSIVIADSIGECSPRLTTFQLRYPKFIHGELMTHRMFSRNASSSRAIPVAKNLEEVCSNELRAAPVWWGREQKGMQSGEELDDKLDLDPFAGPAGNLMSRRQVAQNMWARAAMQAAYKAEQLADFGVHKSIVNRILEPFLYINVVATSCEPGLMNFFGLRLDRAAQPEIRILAEQMWAAWNESKPQVEDTDIAESRLTYIHRLVGYGDPPDNFQLRALQRVSVARCARVSYLSHETGKRSTIKEDLALYERLVGSQPLHASPAEHQATPDSWQALGDAYWSVGWKHPEQHGNLIGWRQYRKTLPGEAMAPLPEGYRKR